MPGRSSSAAAGAKRKSRRPSAPGTTNGINGQKVPPPGMKAKLSHQLRDTIEEEERKQLAAWLDAKHKQLDSDLKKLGVGVTSPSRSRNTTTTTPQSTGPSGATCDDPLYILSMRLKPRTRPHRHIHESSYEEPYEKGEHRR